MLSDAEHSLADFGWGYIGGSAEARIKRQRLPVQSVRSARQLPGRRDGSGHPNVSDWAHRPQAYVPPGASPSVIISIEAYMPALIGAGHSGVESHFLCFV